MSAVRAAPAERLSRQPATPGPVLASGRDLVVRYGGRAVLDRVSIEVRRQEVGAAAAIDRVICINGHACCAGEPEAVSRHPEYVALFGPHAAAALALAHGGAALASAFAGRIVDSARANH